jgi:molybdopterin-containing oxidoreductase family iron-sulfur binding subunit
LDGPDEQPVTGFGPMLCQHCGNAPCEPVCPVYATYHAEDGLNTMVYNRCVGTRYCSNNCSYKVRRFNWFNYEWPEPLTWQLNPDVTVRGVGVMEKCTFCIQRVREASNVAKDEGRPIKDGDVKTACQASCPADAIQFGNLLDKESVVSQWTESKRGYKVLDFELNTQPAITYLAKVTHKDHVKADAHGEHES